MDEKGAGVTANTELSFGAQFKLWKQTHVSLKDICGFFYGLAYYSGFALNFCPATSLGLWILQRRKALELLLQSYGLASSFWTLIRDGKKNINT